MSAPATEAEKALKALRKHVEKNAHYVGGNFADEARSMHNGTSPERAIYGEAQPEQAREMLDEGIPVAPLTIAPTRKAKRPMLCHRASFWKLRTAILLRVLGQDR